MRLLWARVGVPYSPATGLPIESQTVDRAIWRCPKARGLSARLGRGRKVEPKEQLRRQVLRDRGCAGARQEIQARHRRDAVVVRATLRPGSRICWRRRSSSQYDWRWWSSPTAGAEQTGKREKKREKSRSERPATPDLLGKICCRSPASPISEIEPRLFRSTIRSAPVRLRRARVRTRRSRSRHSRQGAHAARRDRAMVKSTSPYYTHVWRSASITSCPRSTPNGRTCRKRRRDSRLGRRHDQIHLRRWVAS